MKLLGWIILVAVIALLYFVRRGRGEAIAAQVQRQVADAQANMNLNALDDINVSRPQTDLVEPIERRDDPPANSRQDKP